MMERDFEKSWNEYYKGIGDRRNKTIAIIALTVGTLLIVPDVIFSDDYPLYLLLLRIGASAIGLAGIILFISGKINNRIMILFYALPVFTLSPYMIAISSDIVTITQLNNTLAIVGIFFMALLILPVSIWIIITSSLYLSYFLFMAFFAPLPISEYLQHGGTLVLIGFLTFPIIARNSFNLKKKNFRLSFELQKQKEDLEYYANNDHLTGAFNRRGGLHILEQAISVARRHNINLSISFIDINGLKGVNDSLGHDAGDKMIQTIASIIKQNIRKSDSLFRYGGDEFIVVFPGCSLEQNLEIMKKIQGSCENFNKNEADDFELSFSYGAAEYKDQMSINELIKSADLQMYKDKTD